MEISNIAHLDSLLVQHNVGPQEHHCDSPNTTQKKIRVQQRLQQNQSQAMARRHTRGPGERTEEVLHNADLDTDFTAAPATEVIAKQVQLQAGAGGSRAGQSFIARVWLQGQAQLGPLSNFAQQ
jgi:hypothetical protein